MATNITELRSYDLFGVKESFANWVSNISPTDTPFVSLTGKESITNKYFQWQTDVLEPAGENAHAEGDEAGDGKMRSTEIQKNVTQILRKVVKVSDTADALSSYGRGSELAYQMEKASAEIKRDLEKAFLTNGDAQDASAPGTATGGAASGTPFPQYVRKTAGFESLVAKTVNAEWNVSVVVDYDSTVASQTFEGQLFKLTEALYTVGADTNIIMFNPVHASKFSALAESTGNDNNRQRMFDGETATSVNMYVSTLVDPLGQQFKLIPNRYMDPKKVFVFNPSDWTQMVLRAPSRIKLAKTGSYEKWMIEMEVGLRHRNPFASGVLTITK